jgi:two-component system chemotaxis response regulator CheB
VTLQDIIKGVSAVPPYRILVVDDSAFMRKFVSDIITEDHAFIVIGSARNGREAIEAVKRHRPDAVTLDVEMPEMTGIEALPVIMKEVPTPVVMMSSSTHEGAAATIRALELGAFDFVAKPSGTSSMDLDRVQESLLVTLRAAVHGNKGDIAQRLQPAPPIPFPPPLIQSSEPPQTLPSPVGQESGVPGVPKAEVKLGALVPRPAADTVSGKLGKIKPLLAVKTMVDRKPPRVSHQLVAIGTSTGGPRALQQVLTRLPSDFPAPILIVQHMPPGFTKSLAQRLNSLCAIDVAEAEDGVEPLPGTAYIAPGGLHMTLRKEAGKLRLRLTNDPPRSGHRPSVDTLFESLIAFPELDRTLVLMTGMGSDGAKGMKLLFDQGVHRTIAEDQISCIVYGMPRAAVELGCVSHSVPLDRIASQISKEVTQAEEV